MIRPIRPNAGLTAEYRKRLVKLIDKMHRETAAEIVREYRERHHEIIGDASPGRSIAEIMRGLARRWQAIFNDEADILAGWFIGHVDKMAVSANREALKEKLPTVKFNPSRGMNAVQQAAIQENVALIRSIPAQYHADVQKLVTRSVASGRDLKTLTDDLTKRYDITRSRAALVARDQNEKATAQMNRTRQQSVGIEYGVWRHSHGGKHPRPDHVKADGKVFKISEGMYLEDEWVLPGEPINCVPESSILHFSAAPKKLWRRRYCGKLTHIVTSSGKVVCATPNHPILTSRGWVSIDSVNNGDYIAAISDKISESIDKDEERCYTSISEAFEAISTYLWTTKSQTRPFDFHGDVSDEKVDTISIDGFLPSEFDPCACKEFCELFFANSDHMGIPTSIFNAKSSLYSAVCALFGAPERIVSGFCSFLSLLKSHPSHAHDICLRRIPELNSMLQKTTCNNISADKIFFSHRQNALSSKIFFDDDVIVRHLFNILSIASNMWNDKAPVADFLGNNGSPETGNFRDFSDRLPVFHKPDCVVYVHRSDYVGYVYNIENSYGWYNTDSGILHNCRCVWTPLIPAVDYPIGGVPEGYKA